MFVHVCLELKGRGTRKKIGVTAPHSFPNVAYSLWWDHLTPKAQPLLFRPHQAPHPQHKHSSPCDICSGHRRAIFPLPWQLAEQARPLAASGGGKKRPTVSGRTPCRPAARELPSVVPGHEHSHPWGPQGPPPLKLRALHRWHGVEVKVCSFCLTWEACEGQSRVGSGEWAGLLLHHELL